MSCRFCEEKSDLIAQESHDGLMFAFIQDGKLCIEGFGNRNVPFVAGGHIKILFCPMCGEEIEVKDE